MPQFLVFRNHKENIGHRNGVFMAEQSSCSSVRFMLPLSKSALSVCFMVLIWIAVKVHTEQSVIYVHWFLSGDSAVILPLLQFSVVIQKQCTKQQCCTPVVELKHFRGGMQKTLEGVANENRSSSQRKGLCSKYRNKLTRQNSEFLRSINIIHCIWQNLSRQVGWHTQYRGGTT